MPPTISYEIEVVGLMDRAWEDWLEAPRILSTVKDGQPVTRLTVQFKNQTYSRQGYNTSNLSDYKVLDGSQIPRKTRALGSTSCRPPRPPSPPN